MSRTDTSNEAILNLTAQLDREETTQFLAETLRALLFDREACRGQRLDIPAGTAIRFEPGDSREVQLVPFAGERRVFGFNGLVNGPLD